MRLVLAALFLANPGGAGVRPGRERGGLGEATRASVTADLSRPIVTRTFTSALIQSVVLDPAEDAQQC